jgi:hypothetical protein
MGYAPGVGCLGPWWTRAFMVGAIWASLSDVRMIMTIMCVLLEELLCQAVMGRILVLECLLSVTRGCLCLRHVTLDIKWRCFLRTQLQWCLPDIRKPWAWLPRAWVHAMSGYEEELQ